MKKNLLLLLSAAFVLLTQAQNTIEVGDPANVCQITIEIDEVESLDEASFTLSLDNPGVGINALSAYFTIDDNQVRPWSYDDYSKSYLFDTNDYNNKTKNGRVPKDHSAMVMLTDETNPQYPSNLYFGLGGSGDFLRETGWLATLYFDATLLKEGIHVLHMVDPMCVNVVEEDGKFISNSYLCANQDIAFEVSSGNLTVISALPTIDTKSQDSGAVYDLSGRQTKPTAPGIYVANGRKVVIGQK